MDRKCQYFLNWVLRRFSAGQNWDKSIIQIFSKWIFDENDRNFKKVLERFKIRLGKYERKLTFVQSCKRFTIVNND